LIFKVLTTPFFDEKIRNDVVQNVRNVLIRIKAQPQQGYKRLMDEVGLSTRNGGPRDVHNSRDEVPRPSSKHSNGHGHMPAQTAESPLNRPYYQGMPPSFDPGMNMQRTASVDSSSYDPYMNNMQAQAYPTSNLPMSNMNNMPQMAPHHQLQYQQAAQAAMLAAASRPPPTSYYQPPAMNMNGGYSSPAPSMDAYRGLPSSVGMNSPLMPQAGFSAPPGFGMGSSQGMFPGYPMQYVPPGMAHAGFGGPGRRRVG
jgi:protein JSN1